MRKSLAAIALISREMDGQTCLLAKWNSGWNAYSLVGGHRESGESFRECLVREIDEELAIQENAHYLVDEQPPQQIEFIAWSERVRVETEYTMQLFRIQLNGEQPLEIIDADYQNRWLTPAEISIGRATNGKAVSPTVAQLLSFLNETC